MIVVNKNKNKNILKQLLWNLVFKSSIVILESYGMALSLKEFIIRTVLYILHFKHDNFDDTDPF